ncbi:hypothetical protein PsorP6_004221 [Peronosclerospora sorghi]|uniref:Uncharacterized protein n=1 Tax=Peronosclerospora sorghi TaxID=230839 RepID=A0ACC0VN19_9STRA|nr:hypothetical protein PsorP6_004221 [Peronosclerospora sorghi]
MELEQIGKCLRLEGNEEEGKIIEERGRQMKNLGFSAMEQDALEETFNTSTMSNECNNIKRSMQSGDSEESYTSAGHHFASQ